MAKTTGPLASLTMDERHALETRLRTCRAIADVLMCGGTRDCAPETVHALGEEVYEQIGAITAALGLDAELQGGVSQ